MNPANFRARAMALAIDITLLITIQVFLFIILSGRLLHETASLELSTILILFSSYAVSFLVAGVCLHMVYFTLFHAWFGQTIGKMIMGLKVVTPDNKRVPLSVAFLRWTGYLLSLIPLGAGFLWSVVDKDHCAWHDRLAKTRVVTVEMT